MRNKFMLPTLGVMAIGLTLAGGTLVHAQTTATGTNQSTSIIQRLVERFGLKTADVQAVFDEERTAREAEMKTKEEAQLTQLVTDGKITEAQKQLIIAKRAELKANQPTKPTKDASLTPAQRKAETEANKTELEAWAKANGIDVKYIMGGFGGNRGHGGPDMMGQPAPTTPSATATN